MSNYQRAPLPTGQVLPASKENNVRNGMPTLMPRPNSAAQYAPAAQPTESPYIEHVKRDSRGNQITKRYLKGALLGKGGFAKCYRITDMDTNEDWACKVVQKASLTKQRHKAKLQTEIKIHRGLGHKHVVKFDDVFEDKDNVYILMELCTNQTMLELVKRKKRLTESETRRFMLQMLDGVRYMHANKVVHRDLKLGNLFLGKNEEVKIGDFGLACKLQYDGERKRTLCGTPNYIAPEVLDSKNGHSYEVDVWSIGVVMYTCLVGKPPFETADVKSTYKLIKANSYSFPDRVHISESAKSLIRRILRTEPELRPTVDELLQDDFFLGEGLAILNGSSPAAGLTSAITSTTTSAATGLTSMSGLTSMASGKYLTSGTLAAGIGLLSGEYRPPLHPLSLDTIDMASNKRPTPSSAAAGGLDSAAAAAAWPLSSLTATAAASRPLHDPPSAAATESLRGMSSGVLRPASAQLESNANKAPSASDYRRGWSAGPAAGRENVAPGGGQGGGNEGGKVTPTKQLAKQLGALDLFHKPLVPALHSAVLTNTAAAPAAPPALGAAPAGPAAGVRDGEDAEALYTMYQNIKVALCLTAPPRADGPAGSGAMPAVWVSKWVDYSKKYGLGYKLSNGCSGVFFNDATKMLLATDGDSLEYMERMREDDGSKFDSRRLTRISAYPEELTKKVTLMQHFKNYLDETHPNRDDTPPAANGGRAGLRPGGEEGAGVYVRKWMRTRHSIIFRLSNNSFQVNFFDDTEVVLWADRRWVTYKGKTHTRATYDVNDVLAVPDLAKRIKYVKDILCQLTTRT